jgi:hypothetical protein
MRGLSSDFWDVGLSVIAKHIMVELLTGDFDPPAFPERHRGFRLCEREWWTAFRGMTTVHLDRCRHSESSFKSTGQMILRSSEE